MANYKKAFNLRSGVQVDDDNFIVNANGLVGIGTSIPREFLDVRGNVTVSGLVTASSVSSSNLAISGVATITTITSGRVRISSGIITASTGIVTYYGDGSGLSNLPTSQWVTTNTPFGAASIYNTTGAIGILTTYPYHYVQIGGNPLTGLGVGFNSTGNIIASGIITANSFSGSGVGITALNASNITGTLTNSVLPSNISVSGIITASSGFYGSLNGNVTGNLTGNVTGIASTALSLPSTANIEINSINSGFSTSGISTIHTRIDVGTGGTVITTTSSGLVGIGTTTPGNKLHVVNSGDVIRIDSSTTSCGILMYDSILGSRIGSRSGNIIFDTNSSERLRISLTGNIGIGSTNPTSRLVVVGDVNISGATTVGGDLKINGTLSSNNVIFNSLGIATNTPAYTLQIGANPTISSGVGISSAGNIVASGRITSQNISVTNINATGVVTASTYKGLFDGTFNNGVSATGLSNVVNSIIAGSGISIDTTTGDVTITATGGGGGGGGPVSRTLITATSSVVGVGLTTNLNISGFKTYGLLKVGISGAGWLRLYVDAASRSADASRVQGIDPAPDAGVITEIISTGSTSVAMSPAVIGWNNDSPVASTIYAAIKNNGAISQAFTIDLTAIQMET